jgi:hypothetical protein
MFKLQGEFSRMKRRLTLSIIVFMFMLSISTATQVTSYSPDIESGTIVTWNVEEVTNFNMWYTGGGYCEASNDSSMEFYIISVGNDVFGALSIGNVSVETNDTMIALDLTLGVWPTWLPGLFVEVGQSHIEDLNETAYAAAERVAGNWMNGTIDSRYENISVGQTIQDCIVFDYQQDSPGTQVTHLAYSLSSGVLVEANTTVTFGNTYNLVISLSSLEEVTIVDMTAPPWTGIILTGIVAGGILAVIVIAFIKLSRQN